MSYFNPKFAAFVVLAIILYSLVKKKYRPLVLLLVSYIFFYVISSKLVIFLLLSTLSVYGAGILIDKVDNKKKQLLEIDSENKALIKSNAKKKKKIILILTIIFNVSFLFFFKYLNFFISNISFILNLFDKPSIDLVKIIAPIGISFYTLQALSYLIDVYNGKIIASKSFVKVALYLSFFTTIIEGPITRFDEVNETLFSGNKITYNSLCFGLQRIIYGFLKKMVIADRLNIFVKTIFNNYNNYGGFCNLLGAIFYTILLYMEFSGTMDVVIGTAEIFNVKLPENFKQPFFSKNISEFWSRWHISLGKWFKDYIFYPVSLSKPVKNLRRHFKNRVGSLIAGAIALFCVWSLNGLWHGAGWTFIVFGMYHFLLILLGNIFEPFISKICTKLKINRKNKFYVFLQIIKTCFLVFIGELFFRAPSLEVAFQMLRKIFTDFSFNELTSGMIFKLGLDIKDYLILGIFLIVILVISILREKGINVREKIAQQNIVIRWSIYYLLILSIIIFGAYGVGYQPVEPIYADF